ncbi:MAG: efflux RND transporter periplasmic adaptor subunit [Chthoniobacterales bacterium]|nr:efflux RND transporter periplasmic adaptor subunit [Chthoniobacterales bacterium]
MNNPDLSDIVHAAQSPSRLKRFLLPGTIVVLLAAAFVLWRSLATADTAKVTYLTEPIQRGDLKTTVTATGNLEPTNEVTVGSELSGTVREVLVETNDRVTKGQVLAKLDTSKLEQQTESSRATAAAAEARVGQAKATLVESEANLQRLQKLHTASGGRLPSQADLDAGIATAERAKADLASAEADVRQAQANVGTNESDLQKLVIRSPIDGIILTRTIEPGQTVAATMTAPELFVVAEKLENMKLKVAVAEADISRLQEGQKATFTVDAWPNRTFEASVKKAEYGSTVTDNVVTYSTELEVSNDDLSLRPGMTATAEIAVAEAAGALLVPNAALRFQPDSPQSATAAAPKRSFVQSLVPSPPRRASTRSRTAESASNIRPGEAARIWVLRDGVPASIPVQTGLTNGRVTVISGEGLSEGLPVIIHATAKQP